MPIIVGDKISLSDSVANPAVNGEIQRNGTTVKIMTDGIVKVLGVDTDTPITIQGETHKLGDWLALG